MDAALRHLRRLQSQVPSLSTSLSSQYGQTDWMPLATFVHTSGSIVKVVVSGSNDQSSHMLPS